MLTPLGSVDTVSADLNPTNRGWAMRRLRLPKTTMILLAILVVAPEVYAQSAVTMSAGRASEMSTNAQMDSSRQLLGQMKKSLRRAFQLLEKARGEKDIVKLNCINEKLASIKGLLKISEQADVALQESAARRDKETADHEYTKVSIAHQKVESLSMEAEGCAGEALHYTGDTRVEVSAEGIDESVDPSDTPPVDSFDANAVPPSGSAVQ